MLQVEILITYTYILYTKFSSVYKKNRGFNKWLPAVYNILYIMHLNVISLKHGNGEHNLVCRSSSNKVPI